MIASNAVLAQRASKMIALFDFFKQTDLNSGDRIREIKIGPNQDIVINRNTGELEIP